MTFGKKTRQRTGVEIISHNEHIIYVYYLFIMFLYTFFSFKISMEARISRCSTAVCLAFTLRSYLGSVSLKYGSKFCRIVGHFKSLPVFVARIIIPMKTGIKTPSPMENISLPERVGWDDHECLSIFVRFLLVVFCCDLFPRAPQQSLLLEISSLNNKHTQPAITSKTTVSLLDSFLRFICKETKTT